MAGPNELVELHCKNVGVCTTGTSASLCLTTVCRVGWEERVGGGGRWKGQSGPVWQSVSIGALDPFFQRALLTLSTQFITNKQSRDFPVTTCSFMATKWCEASLCVQHFVVWLGTTNGNCLHQLAWIHMNCKKSCSGLAFTMHKCKPRTPAVTVTDTADIIKVFTKH